MPLGFPSVGLGLARIQPLGRVEIPEGHALVNPVVHEGHNAAVPLGPCLNLPPPRPETVLSSGIQGPWAN